MTNGQGASKITGREFSFLTEREKLLNNLAAVRKTSGEMFMLIRQLERLFAELELTRGDLHSLRKSLNHTAMKLGLQPISIKPDHLNRNMINPKVDLDADKR